MERTAIITLAILLAGQIAYAETATNHRTDSTTDHGLSIAENIGWSAEYKRGTEIIRSVMDAAKDKTRLKIGAFRGERVAILGGVAPPGGSNDLLTSGGVYLRIVTPGNKDLRPQAAWWEVIVRGEIRQVLPENKIIVIEVLEEDWMVLQAG